MKSLMWLLREVLSEEGTMCCTDTRRDWKTITARFEHEGLSFLTITLPAFAKDLQKGLDLGQVTDDLFMGFARTGGLPRFLGGFLRLVFERGSGKLLPEPSIDAIQAIRQITLLYSKIELPCSDARVAAALDQFEECEQDVRRLDRTRDRRDLDDLSRLGVRLFSDPLQRVDEDIFYDRIVPRHGPGNTADRYSANAKYNQNQWTDRLEEVFPSGNHLLPSWRYYKDLQEIEHLEPGAEQPVRVTLVPKTMKTPRVIALEPACMQYMQQGIMESLVGALTQDDLCSEFLGFDEEAQARNRDCARRGSIDGSLATIDLSEASDRVSNQLVRALFVNVPNVSLGVDATRSRKADLGGGRVIRLAKFASMGSALCFPVESMVFLTLALLGIQRSLNLPLTRRRIRTLVGQVRVFGDDIVVPKDHVQSVVDTLEDFGLRVNSSKSYWNGKFRESCGGDYYDGHDVTIVRVRHLVASRQSTAQEIVATVDLRNRLYKAGLWSTTRALDDRLSGLIPFPTVLPTSPVLGRHSLLGHETQRLCSKLQIPLVRGLVVSSRSPSDPLDGRGALMKWFLKRGSLPYEKDHLRRYGRPDALSTKIRMASAV